MILVVGLLIVLIFGFLVFVHELGHFIAARRNGVEVEEFGFGFPPKLYGKKVGRTEYSINLIPLGGFVKLKGESLSDKGVGSFGRASFWGKTKILLAGVTMNFITAYLLLVGLCLTGLPPIIQGQYSYGSPELSQPRQVMAVRVAEGSPAEKAGLSRGDIILSGNGQRFENEGDLMKFTQDNAGEQVALKVVRDGETQELQTSLRPPAEKQGFLGVTPFQTYKLQYGLIDSLVTAGGISLQLVTGTIAAFADLIAGLFTQGKVSDNVAGPVGIVALLNNILDLGAAYVLVFVVSISISLAVINAMPLPALDGGRWALAAAQKISGRALSEKSEAAVHAAGFAALILLMLVVTFFDVKRLAL